MKIAVIRMHGKFSLSPKMRRTLEVLMLSRLYTCTLLPENPTSRGMLQCCKDVVAYGDVDEQAVSLLLSRRGYTADGKKLSASKKPEEIAKLAKEYYSSVKKLTEFGVRPTFCLSPPKGGFGSRKEQAPLVPLGKNLDMAKLIERMA